MKLGTKIIFFVTMFFSIIFLLGGYSLISYYGKTSMEREVEAAAEQYQYNKFVIQSALITRGEEWLEGVAAGAYDVSGIVSDMNHTVAFCSLDGEILFSDFPEETELETVLEDVETGKVNYRFAEVESRMHVLVAGKILQADTGIYLITGVDVERVFLQQEQMIQWFGYVYAVAIGAGVLLIILLSVLLTRPIKQLTEAAKKIADGNYQERIKVSGEDEVGQLARHFNRMSGAVEEKVRELSDSAKQKEDFAANFAHELKTPLTSIIGYANRIYQRDLSREEQKQAAWYIWNEGMRLEALSHKLMDLTALKHKDFVLQEMQADLLLKELAKEEIEIMKEKNIRFSCEAEAAYINVECDLFQSLLLNLIDNSIKAGADNLQLSGYVDGENFYVIQLEDNGSGIPENEIKRIKEAFYMVDKSRSRKLHGAGIGLSLAEKIAEIHGSSLSFESDGKSGTKVSIRLNCKRGNASAPEVSVAFSFGKQGGVADEER